MTQDWLEVLRNLRERRQAHALATVIETQGSASAKTGSKAVIDTDGRLVHGWVGGGCAESTVCQAALAAMREGEGRIVEIDLNDEVLGVGMPCGGHMRVFVEPELPRPVLWIMGHGRVAETLCAVGDQVGLAVRVSDATVTRDRYPAADELITDDPGYDRLQPAGEDFVVIATQHKGDHLSLDRALESSARYIALIASRKRAALVLDYLRERGRDDAAIARVRSPAGIDIGARTPEEIALSVIAEIVQVRRGGSGAPLAEPTGETPKEEPTAAGSGSRAGGT
ncbi:XdhC family protein [Arhodomonas sp. AD133]|uniref:XdhC family protein n=1 Tax=Arhodomonas sp. AD133 TaxID=3415009 RepID=UPI003EBA5C53